MRRLMVVTLVAGLAACGGDAGGGTPGDAAAAACEATAKGKLDAEGKAYSVDLVALANSMKDNPDGTKFLTAPIVIDPGLTSETKQIVECTVRFTEGKDTPDVTSFLFNW